MERPRHWALKFRGAPVGARWTESSAAYEGDGSRECGPPRRRNAGTQISTQARIMHVIVTQVEVQGVPFGSEERTERWDLFSGPDLYYEVYDPDGDRLYTSNVVNDVRPGDLPVGLDAGFSIEEGGRHILQLLDADLLEDEVVAQVDFAPDRIAGQTANRTSTRILCLQNGDTTLRVGLEWKRDRS